MINNAKICIPALTYLCIDVLMRCFVLSFSNTVFDDVGRIVELFLNEVRGVRSIDGFLVKLTTFVLRLEEVFKDDVGVSRVLENVLGNSVVRSSIESLAPQQSVKDLILSNPRFKPLRKYVDIIAKAFPEQVVVKKREELLAQGVDILNRDLRARAGTGTVSMQRSIDVLRYEDINALLSQCLACSDSSESYLVRYIGNEYEVTQMVGGTRGTDYVYVYSNGFFINIGHVPGARLVVKEAWGRGRTREVYRVPREVIEEKPILRIGFSNKGYLYIDTCIVSQGIVRCRLCKALEEDDKLALKVASMFMPLGSEKVLIDWYLSVVPRMARDVLNIAVGSGAKGVLPTGHAERLLEVLYSAGLSLLTTMVLDSAQGRAQSLLTKISHILELFVAAKIVEALDGVTVGDPDFNYWLVEFTTNRPLAIVRSKAASREYTVFYQPSILPHILPGFVKNAPKHLVPDIIVFKGRIENVYWGELYKLIEQGVTPKLLIEVKTGLVQLRWEEPSYIVEQIREYIELLKPKNTALISLKTVNPTLKAQLKALGVAIFENFANEAVQAEFKKYVVKALM
jgi:hypothetical protein